MRSVNFGTVQGLNQQPAATQFSSCLLVKDIKSTSRLKSLLQCKAAVDASLRKDPSARFHDLKRWLMAEHGIAQDSIKLDFSAGMYESIESVRATTDVAEQQTLLELPATLGVTASDTKDDAILSEIVEGRNELVCLALWLMLERSKGTGSQWHTFLQSLPHHTDSPLLWTEEERQSLLRGSAILAEAGNRVQSLKQEWASLQTIQSNSSSKYPADVFNEGNFLAAMSVVLAHAAYLASAECFALLPLATLLDRTGDEKAAQLDFNLQSQIAAVTAGRPYREGDVVTIYDGRPTGELFLATGKIEDQNPSDNLFMTAELVKADRLFTAKKQIVESLGYGPSEDFPIYADRMPLQLLAYFRLARIQDPADLAKVSFDTDVIVSQNNEYEILQLMMGDCRERLSQFPGSIEDNSKKLQRRDLSRKDRLATRLIISEQKILQGTVDAVRRRLAPIRGVPTKSGSMTDPNQDLKEIFDAFENIPKAPIKLVSGLMSWARGDQDPTWQKGKGKKKARR